MNDQSIEQGISNSTIMTLLWAIVRKLIRTEYEIKQEILESEQRILGAIGNHIDLTDEFADVQDDVRRLGKIAPKSSDDVPPKNNP